jgi:hypothetical protein
MARVGTKGVDMKEFFLDMLNKAELLWWFKNEFGDDPYATDEYGDGWWFTEDTISYRSCDVFDDYSDGYNWDFFDGDYWFSVVKHVVMSHGFIVEYNGGDDEDKLVIFKKSIQL